MSEKYKMFKQFMHNELGITKEDIREWVKESVREEAAKMVAKTYEDENWRDIDIGARKATTVQRDQDCER